VARVARIEPREAPALLKSGSPRAPRLTARLGYLHQSRSIESGCSTLLVWNATSDAVRGGSGCPFAPTMQHSGAADGSANSAVSQDPVRSKHESSSGCGSSEGTGHVACGMTWGPGQVWPVAREVLVGCFRGVGGGLMSQAAAGVITRALTGASSRSLTASTRRSRTARWLM
jgi:hypothetical protein